MEEAETNRKADSEALKEIRFGQAELKSAVEEKLDALVADIEDGRKRGRLTEKRRWPV
jgi:hypothetical protein